MNVVCRVAVVLGLLAGPAHAAVIVEALQDNSDAMRAGLANGDVIEAVRVRRTGRDERIVITDPLQFYEIYALEGWRRPVWLDIQGRTEPLEIAPGYWRFSVRPQLSASNVARLKEITGAIRDGRATGVPEPLLDWHAGLQELGETRQAAWLMLAASEAFIESGNEAMAASISPTPLGDIESAIDLSDRVTILERIGLLPRDGRDLAFRRQALEAAIELQRDVVDDYRLGKLLVHVTAARGISGDLQGAVAAGEEAAELLRNAAPGSFVLGSAMINLASGAQIHGDVSTARHAIDEAAQIYRSAGAPTSEIAGVSLSQGIGAYRRGELSLSEAHYQEALALARTTPTARVIEARTLNNLSLVLRERGDIRGSRQLLAEALATNRALGPNSVSERRNLGNLAYIDLLLGNFESARNFIDENIDFYAQYSPVSNEFAGANSARARIAAAMGDLDGAEAYFERAVSIAEQVSATSPALAETSLSYADFAIERGDLTTAAKQLAIAERIRTDVNPDSIEFAHIDLRAARIALEEGDIGRASARLDNALRILVRETAASTELAEAWYLRYREAVLRGDNEAAAAAIDAALAALERQRSWLPTEDDAQRHFSDRFRHIYEAAVQQSVESGDAAAALLTIERYRARSLLAMLDSRDLFAELTEEQADRRSDLAARYRDMRRAIDEIGEDDRPELRAAMRQLALARASFDDQLRSDLNSRWQPPGQPELQPLQASLRDGTAVVFFSLPDSLIRVDLEADSMPTLHQLPISKTELRSRAREFRLLLSRGAVEPQTHPALIAVAASLYEDLFAALKPTTTSSATLIVVPDAALFELPFAALVTGQSTGPRYLVEDFSVRSIQSLTLHAQLAARAVTSAGPDLVAVADSGDGRDDDTRRGPADGALPGARLEASYLQSLYQDRPTQFLIGRSADEQQLVDVSSEARLLHFAVHAGPDPIEPLDAWLDFADGTERLEAWEIIDRLRLPGSLVTLSACETGAGELIDGEGVISLARAFQTAGARDIVATLWRVPDSSTAILMQRFHSALLAGEPVGEALRQAQLELLHGPTRYPAADDDSLVTRLRRLAGRDSRVDARHPYYWAAFQAIGPGHPIF